MRFVCIITLNFVYYFTFSLRVPDVQDIEDTSIDAVFGKDDDFDTFEDVSDSDGYLSEVLYCLNISLLNIASFIIRH